MNRQHYLHMASQSGIHAGNALELAQTLVSAEDVSRRAAQVKADIAKRLFRVRFADALVSPMGLVGMALVSVLGTYVFVSLRGGDLSIPIIFGALLACITGCAWATVQSVSQDLRISTLHCLQPIAGTRVCLDVLGMIERGYPEVLAWRDIALAERGELYMFDAKVLECLDYSVELAKRAALEAQELSDWEAKHKLEVEAACRKIHGLPTVEA